ncbi:hypothetical protein BH24ACT26_BH24ACT26_05650 [soil metagenome]
MDDGIRRCAPSAHTAVACLLGAALLSATAGSAPVAAAQRARVTRPAGPCEGSSEPTFFPSNRRLAVTAKGRLLAVYDPHGSGQQLVWKDPGGPWRTRTTGDVNNGFFPENRRGDRPATIAVARDGRGTQHAWVVTAGPHYTYSVALRLRRLSKLNAPGGPRVGPRVTIEAEGSGGNARPDLVFERGRRGGRRGVVSWLRRDGGRYEMTVEWFTKLGTDTPSSHHRKVLFRSSSAQPTGTLVATPRGTALVATTARGRLRVYRHRRGAPLDRWKAGRARVKVSRSSIPSAVRLPSGALLAAVGTPSGNVVKVVRWRGGRARVVRRLRGYRHPSLAHVGRGAWLVMIRRRDGKVVSRRWLPRKGWSGRDRVEIGRGHGGGYSWPNALRDSRRTLRFLVQGERCPNNANSNAVLAYSRRV